MSNDKRDPEKASVDYLIDQNIKLLFKELINEGLPDRFKDLLAMIRAEDGNTGAEPDE